MRIPYFKRLDKEEKDLADWMLKLFDYEKLDCWDYKAPEGFDKA